MRNLFFVAFLIPIILGMATAPPNKPWPMIHDGDYDTKIHTEESADEDTIRFDVGGSEVAILDGIGFALGVGFLPVMGLHMRSSQIVIDNASFPFATSKLNSQGVAWSDGQPARTPSLIFNAIAQDRPEISWYRGSRTYPEFSIRQHPTNDMGAEFYSGGGTAAPIMTMAFNLGSVGILTSTPTCALDINSSVNGVLQSRLYNDDTIDGISQMVVGANTGGHINLVSNASASPYFGILAGLSGIVSDWGDMVFAVGSGGTAAERMRIGTNGNVGIGAVNPNKELHVVGNAIIGLSSSDTVTGETLLVESAGDTKIVIRDSVAEEHTVLKQNGSDGDFVVARLGTSGVEIALQANGNVILADGSGGFVGINATNPQLPLEIRNADDNLALFVDTRAQAQGVGGGIAFGGKYTDAGGEAMAGRIGTKKTNGTSGHVGFDMVFETQDSVGSMTERAIFTSDGKCGFGDIVPTEVLDVSGNIAVSGTVDGRDVAADGTKLDGIAAGAEVATKEFFTPAGAGILGSNATFGDNNIALADGVTFARCHFVFRLPSDFSSLVSGYPKIVMKPASGAGGNVRIDFDCKSGGVGEQLGARLDSITEYTKAMPTTSSELIEEDISAAVDGLSLAAGHYVEVEMQRDSDDAADTFGYDLDVVGILVKYN